MMALNRFMHERNPYKNRRPDFEALALKYEKFRQVAETDLRGSVTLDFKKPECLQALSWVLLKELGIDVDIPLDRLIPTIPLRLNYILWLEDMLDRKEAGIHGIDIGTGATCVYPLLAAKKNKWRFLATETDEMSYTYAQHNVQQNNMQEQINVVKVAPKEILEAPLNTLDSSVKYDFCMCNPPFFSNNLEAWGMSTSRSDQRSEPKSVNTASPSESIFTGGEVKFVRHMIADSIALKDRVRIYTTMLGKKTSVSILKEDLRRNKITNVGATEFCQGRTMRWGLAWTFDPTVNFPKSSRNQVRGTKPQIYKVPAVLESCADVPYTVEGIATKLQSILDELQMRFEVKLKLNSKWQWRTTALENTWSHQRRKKRQDKFTQSQHVPESVLQNRQEVARISCDMLGNVVHGLENTNAKQTVDINECTEKSENSDNNSVILQGRSLKRPHTDCEGDGTGMHTKQLKIDATECETDVKLKSESDQQRLHMEGSGLSILNATPQFISPETIPNAVGRKSKNCPKTGLQDSAMEDSDVCSEHEQGDAAGDTTECLLCCDISVYKEKAVVLIQFNWVEGTAKDSMQQVVQFVKNKIK